jgi:glycosyltransferase involved in cell wall biosynthesis
MRVLMMAEDCNPEWPSLPLVGYQMVKALSRRVELTLATHVRNRRALAGHLEGAEVVFIDNEYVAAPLHRLATWVRGGQELNWSVATASAYPSTLAFEHEVRRHFRARLDSGEFDVVHRLTPMSPALPSPMASWSPVPFVLGPLNGGLSWPAEFAAERTRERERLQRFRAAYKWLPYHRSTYRDAAAILTSFEHTLADLPQAARARCIDFPEVGVAPELFQRPLARPDRSRLVFVSVGRFVPLKLLDVAIRVFAHSAKLRSHQLVLVGDGVERPALERLVREHRLGQVVTFTGWVPQSTVAEQLRSADVFLFPSIRELGGSVVVEAMASGCVPVVVDYGGPGGLIAGHDCGCAVPLGDKAQLVQRFAAVLERYVDDRELRERHAQAAYERATGQFAWQVKASKVVEVYEWVTGRRSLRPTSGAAQSGSARL